MDKAIVDKLNDEALVTEAYDRVAADLALLEEEELIAVNVEVIAAVGTTLGLLEELRGFRDQIARELPTFDLVSFDKLEDYALAFKAASTGYLTSTRPPDDLKVLIPEAMRVRARLEQDAKALANYGLVEMAQLAKLAGGTGHRELFQDLDILSSVLSAAWPNIAGKTPLTKEDLQLASRLSTRLTRIVGSREQGPEVVAAAADRRVRAFTQFLNTYEDARRAVGYLRAKKGDADTIIPSLYPGRPRRRAADEDETETGTGNGTGTGTIAPATGTTAPSVSAAATGAADANTTVATTSAEIAKRGPFVK
jgi:hypothetical protein